MTCLTDSDGHSRRAIIENLHKTTLKAIHVYTKGAYIVLRIIMFNYVRTNSKISKKTSSSKSRFS